MFDAQLATTKQASLAQGVPRPLNAPPCPNSAKINLTLPQTTAVLKRPSQPARLRMTSRCRDTAQDAVLIHPQEVPKTFAAAAVPSRPVLNIVSSCCHAAVPSACCPAQKRRHRRRPRRSCAIQRCIRSEHTLDRAVEPFSGLRMAVFVCRVVAGGKGQKRQGCRRQCLRSSADGCVGMWAWFQVVWFVRLD